ncbi:MAG TPA: 4Fe-4S dicluster domain-containing protein [Thermodesulforhabdus norvegica]|uniref:4Fe-4S dicluster domain-containing protein n=1 Tax=Thermodesulforhabdus norvegica TaxID=39841 RepID=A0A7C1AVM7_9BACT|nr:4Fe-4S dicluster domain-containing protein [Thermodesulforhabdus norvegica]
MKELVVISGKGGTGKTSIVAAFAGLAKNAVFADCDVDAADLHLVLEPKVKHMSDFSGGKQASIVAEKCIACGKCRELCRFGAISLDGPANEAVSKTFTVDPISCEGCKVCVEFCPVDAIEFNDSINGRWFISDTRFGTMVHAQLGIAEENSGKLVTLIRKEAKRIASEENKDLIIVDGSPGIGCPVIASITGADLVLIVTEPTLSAKHDLERVVDLAQGFKIPVMVTINKCDLNPDMAGQIEKYADMRNVKVVGKIRYDTAFTKAQILRSTVLEYTSGAVSEEIRALWRNVTYALI